MLVKTEIERKLTDALAPAELVVSDESARHQGHAGASAAGESHFHVKVVSSAFEGKSRLARQRMIYALLAENLRNGVHALSLETLTPSENRNTSGQR